MSTIRPGWARCSEKFTRGSRAPWDCVACVTNGVVRDLPGVEALGFQLFSAGVSVSHAYAHVVDFGEPVEIGGLRIRPGDLLHGDLHGVHTIPMDAARELPGVAEQILREDRELFAFTSRKDFSVDLLTAKLQKAVDGCQ